MSHLPHNTEPSVDISYDPLPGGQEHAHDDIRYVEPPASPGFHTPDHNGSHSPAGSEFRTPDIQPMGLPTDGSSLPPGAGLPQPRFLGAALYNEGGPSIRDSYASSQRTFSPYQTSEANSSVYALNAGQSTTPNIRDSFAGSYRDDPRESGYYGEQVPIGSLSQSHGKYLGDKRQTYAAPAAKSKRKILILGVLGGLILLILAVVIPIYFAVIKKNGGSGASNTADPSKPSSSAQAAAVVSGGDGSKITTGDGSTFTYSNTFGGTWYWDENDPFNNNAQAQSWTPALNSTFKYGIDRIRGVNLGGWLTLEPFISPALYEKYLNNPTPAVDEWTLSQAMANDTAGGGLQQLENHYKTFITEQDFAQIAGAGLNFVRIPLPYWAIEVRDNEPFLPKTSWTYFLKAIQWARKYGLRINLDFHALPGSQNGWNHSGRLGSINVLLGPMGLANAQRSLDYIRIIAEFISQPEYKDVVAIFGVTNEPQGPTVGQPALQSYYLQAYNEVRSVSGIGQGNGPFIALHDGFLGQPNWAGFLPNADRVAMDIHPYLCFGGQSDATMDTYANTPCSTWGESMNTSMSAFGLNAAGEWSNAVTDCGLWVNGVNLGTRYEGNYTPGTWPRVGSCETWTNWQAWDQTMKSQIQTFAEASMDALQNWFFWTWKIGNSSVSGTVEAPAWSYQLGLENGWMPTDPRKAAGACKNANPWNGPLSAWQTGGSGAGNIPASISSSFAWPPSTISSGGVPSQLPTYTPTGTVATLPGPSFTGTGKASASAVSGGNGWFNPSDTAGAMVAVSTCSYLDPWIGPSAAPPSPLCGGGGAKRRTPAPEPMITPPPQL